MTPSGDSGPPESPSGDTIPDPDAPAKSVRGEIAQFFGAPEHGPGASRRDPAGFDRLLADLEQRILSSVRRDAPPAEVGPFVLEEVIGRGGFAVVYRATHVRTGARAAVKLVPASDEHSHDRILTEVESLIRLNHPNIVRVIDTGEDAGFAWVATDYIEGMTLAAFIRSAQDDSGDFHFGAGSALAPASAPPETASRPATGRPSSDPASLRRVMTWFRDLAGALEALHEAQLVHRDVKPANILIDSRDRPFLIDFGLSSSAESTVDGILAGTVPYMSPEQTLGGWVALGPRSDVYSLAATFHEVLTGHRVTRGAKREAILHEIAFVPVPPPSQVDSAVPASLDPIFRKALAKDSNQRYESAKQLAEDLDCWLAGLPLRHVTEKIGSRAGRVARRHPIGLALAAVVILVAAGWSGWALYAGKREYEDVLSRIKAALDGGQSVAALSMLAENQPRYEDRSEFHQLHREAVRAGGEPFLRAMLEKQSFAVSSLAADATHTRLAEEARVHLAATGIPEAHLVLVVSASAFFAEKVEEAQATLAGYRSTVDRTPFLSEFEAVTALHRFDRRGFEAVMTRLAQLPPASADPTDACMRAWRINTSRERYPDIKIPVEEANQVEEDLKRHLKKAEHAFARMMLVWLLIDRSDYGTAQIEIQRFSEIHANLADEAGTSVVSAGIWMVLAGQTTGKDREQDYTIGSRKAKSALEIAPHCRRRLLYDLRRADVSIRIEWIKTALDESWAKRPRFDILLLTFVAKVMETLSASKTAADAEKMVEIAHVAERQPEFGDFVRSPDHLAFQLLHLWALQRMRTEWTSADRMADAREMAARSRQVVDRFRRASLEIPYRLGVEDALAEGFVARTEPDHASQRIKIREAMEHLRKLDRDDVLEEAKKKVPDKERPNLEELRKLCVEEIDLLLEVPDRDRPDSR